MNFAKLFILAIPILVMGYLMVNFVNESSIPIINIGMECILNKVNSGQDTEEDDSLWEYDLAVNNKDAYIPRCAWQKKVSYLIGGFRQYKRYSFLDLILNTDYNYKVDPRNFTGENMCREMRFYMPLVFETFSSGNEPVDSSPSFSLSSESRVFN